MKHKTMKTVVIVLLCFVFLAGCAVVPTPDATPEATPTPVPPTPTASPIPYGEVLDLNVCLLADRISDLYPVSHFSEILLEKFSLKIKLVSDIKEADFVYDTRERQHTDRDYINVLKEYGDRMPNYKALFENNDMYHVWMYNEEWFEKNGYSIPRTMDELVSLLVEHKKTHPDEKPIFEPKLKNGKSLYNEFGLTRTEIAIGLTYGIDMNKSMSSKNEKYKAYTHAKKIISTVRENDLIDRKENTYNYRDISEYAVLYTGVLQGYMYVGEREYEYYNGLLTMMSEGKSWKVFETQLSSNSEKIHVSMMGYESDLKFNYEMSTYKNKYYIRNNNKPEVVARMVDYFDWCCTDEGIIKSLVGNPGKNYTYDENGKIIGLTSGIPSAIQFVDGQFAYTFILPKYLHSESTYRQSSYIRYYAKVYDALHDKNLVNLQITSGPYGPNEQ